MFGLKPDKHHPKYFSDEKVVLEGKKGYWKLQENYDPHYIRISYWKYEEEKWKGATYRKGFNIPLSWEALYILCIYHHLGICHKDLRSKFYIGKAREKRQ